MKLRHLRLTRLFIRLASFTRRHLIAILLSFLLLVLGYFVNQGLDLLARLHIKPVDFISFLKPPSEKLDNTNGATNFLILGIRGEGVDSPNLADTIIVLSYDHTQKTSAIISVPRDLWVPSLQAKMNSTYYYGEEASRGAGIKMSQAAILEDLGIPIHYTAVVNFTIFKETIDLIGGIDVDVQPGFTDPKFPILGMENALPESSRYEVLNFATGSAHMNGETTLKFVRSRHSDGDEGTDFARNRRQRQVISAMRQKMLNTSFVLDEKKIDALFDILGRNLITNIDRSLYPTLAKVAFNAKDSSMKSISFSDKPDENGITILYHPPVWQYKGEWVLMPKDNNWSALKKYLTNLLQNK